MKKPAIHFQILLLAFLCRGLGGGAYAEALAWPDEPGPAYLDLVVGTEPAEPYLHFGWSQNEGRAEMPFRWIKTLEADVIFPVEAPGPAVLWIHAQPLYLNWKQQKVGVYLNGQYLGGWEYPPAPGYRVNRLSIPDHVLLPGENRMTLRMGYRSRFKTDKRELALAVHRILIQKKSP